MVAPLLREGRGSAESGRGKGWSDWAGLAQTSRLFGSSKLVGLSGAVSDIFRDVGFDSRWPLPGGKGLWPFFEVFGPVLGHLCSVFFTVWVAIPATSGCLLGATRLPLPSLVAQWGGDVCVIFAAAVDVLWLALASSRPKAVGKAFG